MYRIADQRGSEQFRILNASAVNHQNTRKLHRAVFFGSLSAFLLCFLLALPALYAQTSSGQVRREGSSGIVGSVKDPHEAAVVGAQVKLTDPLTNQVLTALSDGQGAYRFSSLAAAVYNLEVSAKGFKTVLIQGVKVTAYNIMIQDVALSIGETSEIVQVTATAPERDYERLPSPTLEALPESIKLKATVITRDEIEAIHPQTVWDVLQQIPGMEVTFQGRQHMEFSTMRGGNYRIILDGVYLSQTDRLLASIPSEMIESMTVVRDATALSIGPLTSFGSSRGASNQGFVVIKTKRASKLSGGFTGSVGTYDTAKGTLYQGARIGSFDYNVAATYYNTDGKKGLYNASRNGSVIFRTGYSKWGFKADVLYYASRGSREMQLGEILLPTAGRNGILDYTKVGTLAPSIMAMPYMYSSMVGVNLAKPWGDSQTTTFQYAYNRLDVDTTDDTSSAHNAQDTREQNFNLRHAVHFRNNDLTVGSQFLKYFCPGAGGAHGSCVRSDEGMFGLYVQDEYHMLGDRLIVDGGIRSDKKHYNASPVTGLPVDEWAKAAYTYSFGASYKLSPLFNLNARYGYSESGLSSDQISATGSALPAERRSRYEAGIIANLNPHFKPWITLYYYDTKNQKVLASGKDPATGKTVSYYIDPVTGEEISFVTASDVLTKGAEIGISGQILGALTYNSSYSYVMTDNATQNLNISHQLVNARLSYRYRKAFASVSMNYAGPRYYSKPANIGGGYLEMANYARVDANAGFNLRLLDRATRITFYGRNLGNNHYFTMYKTGAYRDLGLQYGMELSFSFF